MTKKQRHALRDKLPDDVLDAMYSLVGYLIDDEKKHYEEEYADDDGNVDFTSEEGKNHVYRDVLTVQHFIEKK